MKKEHDDALSIAERCEKEAAEAKEALPSHAETLTLAARAIRAMHQALIEQAGQNCQHMFTFKVTKEMKEKGMDDRDPGKYCVTCGDRIDRKKKATDDTPSSSEGGDES